MRIRQRVLRWFDTLAVCFKGSVRVRVIMNASGVTVYAIGQKLKRMPADRLARIVEDLKPGSAGTIDVWYSDGSWTTRASSSLREDGFVQRLRNVLVNS
jgi:hypothetical protein